MKLIHKPTGNEIKEGSQILIGDNLYVTVSWCPPPHKPSSQGKMTVKYLSGQESSVKYCSVFDCEWIDREDREEQDQALLQRATQNTPMTVKLQPALPAGEEQIPIVGAGKFHTIPSSSSCVRTADQTTIEQIALMQQTIERLQRKLDRIREVTDGWVDRAEDASEVSKLANNIWEIL